MSHPLSICIGLIGWAMALLADCSSAPKRPAEISTGRKLVETQLESANKEADRGNYEEALIILEEARRLAVSTDNPSLLIQVKRSWGNVLYSLGRKDEAAEVWNSALAEAESAGEKELAGVVRIYIARARLLANSAAADEVKSQVSKELGGIKSDQLSLALGWTVIGLAEKESRRWTEAETAIKKALEIHEKGNYLEQAAYDWYLIASIRSRAEQYDSAIEALQTAIGFDRRAENTYGLGTDWRALGDVYKKAGNQAEALAAYRRSADIFRSAGFEQEAAEVETRFN
jgi:tetratricopeptide (TPR) repeat protein